MSALAAPVAAGEAGARASRAAVARTARWIGLAAFLALVASGGGRIVGSDEVTMLELARSMLHGRIDVPEGATLKGPDGRFYTKNAAGQAVLALPLVAVGEAASAAAGPAPARRTLALRFVASFFNAMVVAVLLAVFYRAARSFGVRAGAALAATLMLGFTTPLWVYAKSFMAEPLQALGLLLALWGSVEARDHPRRAWTAAIGFLIASQAKASMTPLAMMCLIPVVTFIRLPAGDLPGTRLPLRQQLRALGGAFVFAGVIALSLTLHALYDFARFHDVFQSGYGAQATVSAYTTPVGVGLYGLLVSSGKGVMWFAPGLWLAPAGWRAMWKRCQGTRLALLATFFVTTFALWIYSTFEHWAGDGSFGPRYLVPLLPLAFLGVAFALDAASRARRVVAIGLATAGLVVQIGGVSIHYGAQMREAGDFPYTRALNDPRFMIESHFHPAFSPIAGHWRMLARNLSEHLAGRYPRLTGEGEADARVGVPAADQARLLHALDFWWLYMRYAGLAWAPIAAAVAALLAALAWAAARTRAALRAEAAEEAAAR